LGQKKDNYLSCQEVESIAREAKKVIRTVLVFGDLLRNFSTVLTDHAYIRSDYPRRNTSAVVWLLASLVAAFVIELVLLSPWFGSSGNNLVMN
jgi:hypothetical protein